MHYEHVMQLMTFTGTCQTALKEYIAISALTLANYPSAKMHFSSCKRSKDLILKTDYSDSMLENMFRACHN